MQCPWLQIAWLWNCDHSQERLISEKSVKFDPAFFLLERSRNYRCSMSNDAYYLGTLEAAILIEHRCKATHKETVYVEEKTVEGDIVWEGDVETFDLTGHEEARACYAWQHVDRCGNAKIFAVLSNKFIDSPKRAVQAAIFIGAQPPIHQFSKDMELLRRHLEECKDLFHQIGMKAEDLNAAIYTAQGIHETIKQNHPPS